jgi:hypothetical protein
MQTSTRRARAAAFGSLSLVYWIDRSTSSEISLFPLYLLPIGLTLFGLGSKAAYLTCLLSALAEQKHMLNVVFAQARPCDRNPWLNAFRILSEHLLTLQERVPCAA